MIGAGSVICGYCEAVMDRSRTVSIMDQSDCNNLIFLGFQYDCPICNRVTIADISASPLFQGDKQYEIIREKGIDWKVS